MKPLVTIITPVYNAMPYLIDYLESVLTQTYRPIQLICVNDGSSDESLNALEGAKQKFQKAKIDYLIINQIHQGQATAVKNALLATKGEFLSWCDADDVYMPTNIERLAEFLTLHHNFAMVRCDGQIFDGATNAFIATNARNCDKSEKDIFDDLFRDLTYCYAGCYMIRTSALFRAYPNRSIPISPEGQNLQLLLPIASCSLCGFVPEVLHTYYKRYHSHSNMQRSYTEQLRRAKNFTNLKKAILQFCDCNREYYGKLADELEQKRIQQLKLSAIEQIRKEIRHEGRNINISQSR